MRPIVVVPWTAEGRVRGLLASAGWEIERKESGEVADMDGAVALAGTGFPVLFVSSSARVARRLRHILVPHEGSPRVAAGVRVANKAAAASGAGITVLHVPAPDMPAESGSLPAPRVADHGRYDWQEWRDEFYRRFCPHKEGVTFDVQVALGAPAKSILEVARRVRADLIVMAWRGDAGPGRARIVRAVAKGAPCPILLPEEREPGVGKRLQKPERRKNR